MGVRLDANCVKWPESFFLDIGSSAALLSVTTFLVVAVTEPGPLLIYVLLNLPLGWEQIEVVNQKIASEIIYFHHFYKLFNNINIFVSNIDICDTRL